MNQIVEVLEPAMVERLGWVLLHSVWQIALIGTGFVAANRMLAKRSANSRYIAGCLALTLMTLSPMATYWHLSDHSVAGGDSHARRDALVSVVGLEVDDGASQRSVIFAESTLDLAEETALNSDSNLGWVDLFDEETSTLTAELGKTPQTATSAEQFSIADGIRRWLPSVVTAWLLGVGLLSLRPIFGFCITAQGRLRRAGVGSCAGR